MMNEIKKLWLLERIEQRNHRLETATEVRVRRQSLIRRIAEVAVDGKVAVWESGMDCDCVRFRGFRTIIDASISAFDREENYAYETAEGPISLWVESPLKKREHHSRDLVLEAFEDGHPHSV